MNISFGQIFFVCFVSPWFPLLFPTFLGTLLPWRTVLSKFWNDIVALTSYECVFVCFYLRLDVFYDFRKNLYDQKLRIKNFLTFSNQEETFVSFRFFAAVIDWSQTLLLMQRNDIAANPTKKMMGKTMRSRKKTK